MNNETNREVGETNGLIYHLSVYHFPIPPNHPLILTDWLEKIGD